MQRIALACLLLLLTVPSAAMAQYVEGEVGLVGADEEASSVEETEHDGTRFRWGISLHAGPVLPVGADHSAGAFGGLAFRLGAQIDNTWSVYYQGTLDVGYYA